MSVLAIVPARRGSKSVPDKNVAPFRGRPLLVHSIEHGLLARNVDRVLVSTDSPRYREIALTAGAEAPFLRPAEYSQDQTADLPVFQHALRWLAEEQEYHPDIVVQLRPTSPLRRVAHIDQAVSSLLAHPDADAIRTVCIPFQNPFKMWRIRADGFMHPLIESLGADQKIAEPYNMPRQALPEVFWQTGYVDAAWTVTIMKKGSMTGERILPLVIDPGDWIDIDSPDDWRRAERLLQDGEISLDDLGFHLT